MAVACGDVYAVTGGGGAFKFTINNLGWTPVNIGLTNLIVSDFVFIRATFLQKLNVAFFYEQTRLRAGKQ